MMTLTYAPAQEADIEAIFAFNKEQIDRYEDTAAIDYEKVLGWVRRKLRQHISEYMCIRVDGETAGYYHFHMAEGKMELDDLYLFPEWRGKGIGTAVIEKCCAQARGPVFLYVFKKNCRAVALYEKMGFRVTREAGGTRYIMERDG
ncbi:MAG: GNAT family N-acetyltransferase [Oscillospiraceae bacterium]